MKRKKAASHENHERWLVSYADFITLLFAFFVVMFASSQADKTKAKQVSESVREALDGGEIGKVLATVLGRGRHEAALAVKLPPRPDGKDNNPPPPPPKRRPLRRTLGRLQTWGSRLRHSSAGWRWSSRVAKLN